MPTDTDSGSDPASAEIPPDSLPEALLGLLSVSGAAFEDRIAAADRALAWFRHLQGFGLAAIPFFAVHDVGHLLLLADRFPFAAVSRLDRWSEEERPIRLAYENRFLNALRCDAGFRRASATIVEGPAALHDARIQRVLEILFDPARGEACEASPSINPVHLRDLAGFGETAPPTVDTPSPGALRILSSFLRRQASRIEIAGVFREEDLFELAHWEALDHPHLRLIARRVRRLAAEAGPVDLARTRLRVESPESSTALHDAGSYPTGGLEEVSTGGSIENLVRSELVWRDADPHVDLFALRWAEGDLLYYVRDSGVLHRKRRALAVVLEPAPLRLKKAGHVVSASVLAYAFAARVAEDLLDLFGGDGARVTVHLLSPEADRADREEHRLMERLLADPIRRGVASVSLVAELEPSALVDPRRRSYVVPLGGVALPDASITRRGGTVLRLALDASASDPAAAIRDLRDALLTQVVGLR